MNSNSIQLQLAESIQAIYKDSVVKKVNKDNFVDIYLPSINSSKGTHLFFNTANSQIKLGFYIRDLDFIDKVLSKSLNKIESYSQGLRLKGNPKFDTVDQAISAVKDFLLLINPSPNSSKPIPTDSLQSTNATTKPEKVQVASDDLGIEKIISKKSPPKKQNNPSPITVKQEKDSDLTKALSQLIDSPSSPQTAPPKVKKVKKPSATKPLKAKPKKSVTTPKKSLTTPASKPKPNAKISWFESILEFLSKLIK